MIDFCNIDTATSYATEHNLDRALTKFGIDKLRHMVVRNRRGRWTAIFFLNPETVGVAPGIAHLGFKVTN